MDVAGAHHVDGALPAGLGVLLALVGEADGVPPRPGLDALAQVVGRSRVPVALDLEEVVDAQLLVRLDGHGVVVLVRPEFEALGGEQGQDAPLAPRRVQLGVRGIGVRRAEVLLVHVLGVDEAVLHGVLDEVRAAHHVLLVRQVQVAQAGTVGGHEHVVVRHAPCRPDLVAVELDDPDLVAVRQRHRLAGVVPAVLLDQVAHDLHGLSRRLGALQHDVLDDPGVDGARRVLLHDLLDLLAAVVGDLDTVGGLTDGHALLVHEGVAGEEIAVGVRDLGRLVDLLGVPLVTVGILDYRPHGALGPIGLRDDEQSGVRRAGIVVVRDHGAAIHGGVLAHRDDRTGQRRRGHQGKEHGDRERNRKKPGVLS